MFMGGRRLSLSGPMVEEPGIVLQWLVSLRWWAALAGQVLATLAAVEILGDQVAAVGDGEHYRGDGV